MVLEVTEKQVISLWRDIAGRTALVSEEGEPIDLVYPGRTNDDRGADFRDAVIIRGGIRRRGDIEVHVRSSLWRQHGHHLDVAYNRVVLHVALRRDEPADCSYLRSGESVPLVVLHKYLITTRAALSGCYQSGSLYPACGQAIKRISPAAVAGMLDDAGERRFLDKAGLLQAEIASLGAGQCVYRNMMAALGYSRNKSPFLELAGRLPLWLLESAKGDGDTDEEYTVRLQALLLGTAGLLPLQHLPRDGAVEEWMRRLEEVSAGLLTDTMSRRDWSLFKVRPHNHPVRRLCAMSYLLLRFQNTGLFKGMIKLLQRALSGGNAGELERSLAVTCDGYWAWHCDFGRLLGRRCATLLGREQVAVMAVNVLLPFVYIWSKSTARRLMAEQARKLYHRYHPLPGNSVTGHMMTQLGLDGKLVNSACRQQGLMHLYQNYCIQGACQVCILHNTSAYRSDA